MDRGARARPSTSALPTHALRALARPRESAEVELDHNGQRVEIFSAASPGGGASPPAQQMTSTYRLAPLKKLRMCIPGALELEPPRATCRGSEPRYAAHVATTKCMLHFVIIGPMVSL